MGVQLKFTLKAKPVIKGIQRIIDRIFKIPKFDLESWLEKVVKILQVYPPPRPKQKYKRTYKLRRGWKVRRVNEFAYMINNRVSYTKYVQGSALGEGQAWMHKGRWKLMRDIVDDEYSGLPRKIKDSIGYVARSAGL